jgi:hypothetical protein
MVLELQQQLPSLPCTIRRLHLSKFITTTTLPPPLLPLLRLEAVLEVEVSEVL